MQVTDLHDVAMSYAYHKYNGQGDHDEGGDHDEPYGPSWISGKGRDYYIPPGQRPRRGRQRQRRHASEPVSDYARGNGWYDGHQDNYWSVRAFYDVDEYTLEDDYWTGGGWYDDRLDDYIAQSRARELYGYDVDWYAGGYVTHDNDDDDDHDDDEDLVWYGADDDWYTYDDDFYAYDDDWYAFDDDNDEYAWAGYDNDRYVYDDTYDNWYAFDDDYDYDYEASAGVHTGRRWLSGDDNYAGDDLWHNERSFDDLENYVVASADDGGGSDDGGAGIGAAIAARGRLHGCARYRAFVKRMCRGYKRTHPVSSMRAEVIITGDDSNAAFNSVLELLTEVEASFSGPSADDDDDDGDGDGDGDGGDISGGEGGSSAGTSSLRGDMFAARLEERLRASGTAGMDHVVVCRTVGDARCLAAAGDGNTMT